MSAYLYSVLGADADGSLWMEVGADDSLRVSLWTMSNGVTAKMYVPPRTARKKKHMRALGSRVDNYQSDVVIMNVFSIQWLTPKHTLKICACCYKSNARKSCSQCGKVRYCSRACYLKHWKAEHRRVCNWGAETLLKKIQTYDGADTVIRHGKVRQKVTKYVVQDWTPHLSELVFLCALGNYDLYMDAGVATAYTSELVFGDPTIAVMYNSAVSKLADVSVFGPVLAKKHVEREQRADPCAICLEELTGEVSTLVCGHSFHRDCMSDALKSGHSVCPLCRTGLAAVDRGNARKHTDIYTQEHVVVRRVMMGDTSIVPSSLNNGSSIRIFKVPMCPGGATTQPPFYGIDMEKMIPMWESLKKPPRTRAIVLVLADTPYYAIITNIKIKVGFDPITIVPPQKN